MPKRPGGVKCRGWLVVIADWAEWWWKGLRESGAGSPNGPPSHRLAPGGFYCVDAGSP